MGDQDLPLLSNINDIRARHYLIHLRPSFDTKIIQGKVFIFFEPTTSCERRGNCCTRDCFCSDCDAKDLGRITAESQDRDINETVFREVDKEFEVILDCCDVRVSSVTEVSCEGIDLQQYLHPHHSRVCKTAINFWSGRDQVPLLYTVSPWCITISKEGIKDISKFPQVVCITYQTMPQGKSLLWRNDQDGNSCVFTPAAAINNRSLLPYQDPPSAMATWQAWITVGKEYTVSMTGDTRPITYACPVEDTVIQKHMEKDCYFLNKEREGRSCHEDITDKDVSRFCHYYYTTMVLPIATIAIAIGKWKVDVLPTVNSKGLSETVEDKGDQMKAQKIKYSCYHYEYPCHMKPTLWKYQTPLTIVYPPSCTESIKPLSSFLPYALEAAIHLLGVYPCCRLEVVILPPCFGSLGLASPNLIFLSPSIVLDDPATYIRLAHEISHAWFGIVIGAKDWTEEWLSEGFATYMEDSIFGEAALAYQKDKYTLSNHESSQRHTSWQEFGSTADGSIRCEVSGSHDVHGNGSNEDCYMCINHPEFAVEDGETKLLNEGPSEVDKVFDNNLVCSKTHDGQILGLKNAFLITACRTLDREKLDSLSSLRAHIRYRTLASELENSAEELQTLRPMQGKGLVDTDGVNYVKNGLNVEKAFLQVHYLKGYFLLKYLSKMVGRGKFDDMIKDFVSIYHGQLILSKHVLNHFIRTFPQVIEKGINQEILYTAWLHQPGLNIEMKEMYENISDDLVLRVRQHLHFWKHDKSRKKSGQTVKKAKVQLESFLFPDQLVLLLEYLLQLPRLSKETLFQIYEYYTIKVQCGDIRHRWCELAIKNNYDDLTEVERFLLKDQSMGVYLYGELMISRKLKHRQLAKKVFSKIEKEMDENAQLTVFSMIYGE